MSLSRFTMALVLVVGGSPFAIADTIVSATTFLAGNLQGRCTVSDPLVAGCEQAATVDGQSLGADSFARNTWIYGPGGSLTTSAFALNKESSANASVQFSDFLTAIGATGSGNLLVTFTTSWSYTSGPNFFPPPGDGEGVGNFFYGETVFGPQFASSNYVRTLSFPVSFNTMLPFYLGFGVSATGQQRFPSYPVESQTVFATMAFPTFQVADSAGTLIPNASVVFTPAIQPVPEPSGGAVMTLGLAVLSVGGRRWLKRRSLLLHPGRFFSLTCSLSRPSV